MTIKRATLPTSHFQFHSPFLLTKWRNYVGFVLFCLTQFYLWSKRSWLVFHTRDHIVSVKFKYIQILVTSVM